MRSTLRRPVLELLLVAIPGVLNLASEVTRLSKTAVVAGAAMAWLAYVAVSVRRDPSLLSTWGFRKDTFGDALRAVTGVTAAAGAGIVAWAALAGRLPPPPTFWLALAVYPAWGLAQQFLLNGMLLRNLQELLSRRAALPLAALLFSASHLPDLPLVALTLPAGLVWCWIYQRWPNLWALGLGHGVLGTLAYYLALGRDPLAALGF